MAAALMKTRLPEVNFVEQGEPLIQDLIRFGPRVPPENPISR
jgi:hypothetical protein